tara:strand:- start:4045 stop:4272 length:228 start_codon:yes stop_codon:yes gene_type:complete
MKTKTTKYFVHNFDGNLIGPDGAVYETDTPDGFKKFGHNAYEFDSKKEAEDAQENLLGHGNGGVISEKEIYENQN